MTNVDLARVEFAFVTINHFFFVPITIGLAFLTALLQTAWHRSGKDDYLRLTRFFGTLLVINVAIGVVTGLVQEFQFGMNWGAYSRLVGNVFGAPLAMEGLAAFFLESTFLGLWLFGWDRLPRRIHLLTIWAVSFGSALSAAFILAANSWMQHPVGYQMVNGKPQLNDIWALFTNPVFVWGYAKVLFASLTTGAVVMLAVSAWQLRHGGDREVFTRSARLALVVLVPGDPVHHAGGRRARGDRGQVPADEDRGGGGAVDHLPAVLVLAVPDRRREQRPDPDRDHRDPAPAVAAGHQPLERPGGRHDPAAASSTTSSTAAGNYVPNVFIQYWGMRVMAYLAVLVLVIAVWGLWLIRRKTLATSRVFLWVAVWGAVLPFLMNTAGWFLTESGRQPWIVQGIMLTKNGISPTLSTTWLWISLIAFIVLYGTFATVDLILMLRYSRKELPPPRAEADADAPVPAVLY